MLLGRCVPLRDHQGGIMSTVTPTARSVSANQDRIPIEGGIDPLLGTSARRDALCAAIAQHGGVIDWTVDHTGWVVTLYLPMEGMFSGGTLEDGLRSCLAWLVTSGEARRAGMPVNAAPDVG